MAKCSRCDKDIGFLTKLIHDEKELCFDCIRQDEIAEERIQAESVRKAKEAQAESERKAKEAKLQRQKKLAEAEAQMEREMENIVLCTTNEIPGRNVLQYVGLITHSDYCELIDHHHNDVNYAVQTLETQLIRKLQRQAVTLGANGVVGIKINKAVGLDSYATGGGGAGFTAMTVHAARGIIVSVYGTAVVFESYMELL